MLCLAVLVGVVDDLPHARAAMRRRMLTSSHQPHGWRCLGPKLEAPVADICSSSKRLAGEAEKVLIIAETRCTYHARGKASDEAKLPQ